MSTDNIQLQNYARMGRAALLPGLQFAIDLLNAEAARLREELHQPGPAERRNAPSLSQPTAVTRARSGWSDDPEERRREMARRMAKRGGKLSNHPRDPNHPGHQKWLRKLRKAHQQAWDKLSPAERKARVDRMHKGPRARLAVAS